MGGGGFLSEAGLRERAQAQGRVFGAGGREFEFGLFGFGTLVLLGILGRLPFFTVFTRVPDTFWYIKHNDCSSWCSRSSLKLALLA